MNLHAADTTTSETRAGACTSTPNESDIYCDRDGGQQEGGEAARDQGHQAAAANGCYEAQGCCIQGWFLGFQGAGAHPLPFLW